MSESSTTCPLSVASFATQRFSSTIRPGSFRRTSPICAADAATRSRFWIASSGRPAWRRNESCSCVEDRLSSRCAYAGAPRKKKRNTARPLFPTFRGLGTGLLLYSFVNIAGLPPTQDSGSTPHGTENSLLGSLDFIRMDIERRPIMHGVVLIRRHCNNSHPRVELQHCVADRRSF